MTCTPSPPPNISALFPCKKRIYNQLLQKLVLVYVVQHHVHSTHDFEHEQPEGRLANVNEMNDEKSRRSLKDQHSFEKKSAK